MKLLTRLMVVAGILYALPLSAQTVNLSSLYQSALEYDAQVRGAKADYQVSKEEINKAISQFRPIVRVNGSRGRNETKSVSPGYYAGTYNRNDQFYNSINYGVSVQQPLFNMSSIAGYKQAKAVTAKSDAVVQNETSNLIIRIAEAYCNALYAEDNHEFSKALLVKNLLISLIIQGSGPIVFYITALSLGLKTNLFYFFILIISSMDMPEFGSVQINHSIP